MRASRWVAMGGALCALLLSLGCGGGGGLPAWLRGTWVVVLSDAAGYPQEAFTFSVYGGGDAHTSIQDVGQCDPAGLLSMAFNGWSGASVVAPIQLAEAGTGIGTWTRSSAAPNSGAAACTRAAAPGWSGNFILTIGGDPHDVQINAEGEFFWGDTGVGVVGPGGALVVAFQDTVDGGPVVLTGPVTAAGGGGTALGRTGPGAAWTLAPAT